MYVLEFHGSRTWQRLTIERGKKIKINKKAGSSNNSIGIFFLLLIVNNRRLVGWLVCSARALEWESSGAGGEGRGRWKANTRALNSFSRCLARFHRGERYQNAVLSTAVYCTVLYRRAYTSRRDREQSGADQSRSEHNGRCHLLIVVRSAQVSVARALMAVVEGYTS